MGNVFVIIALIAFVLMIVASVWPKKKRSMKLQANKPQPSRPIEVQPALPPVQVKSNTGDLSKAEARELFRALRKE